MESLLGYTFEPLMQIIKDYPNDSMQLQLRDLSELNWFRKRQHCFRSHCGLWHNYTEFFPYDNRICYMSYHLPSTLDMLVSV